MGDALVPARLPKFNEGAFDCPYCEAFSAMRWSVLREYVGNRLRETEVFLAHCLHCSRFSIWLGDSKTNEGKPVYPARHHSPGPHPDMPPAVQREFEEARAVLGASSRAASAMLRLAIQRLLQELGLPGKAINDDIGELVRQGLHPHVQQALDVVRVIGNNAVHPGELSPDDVEEVALSLFELVNFIVEDRIGKPQKIGALFGRLPARALEAIKKRDAT